nr:exo-alpha-(1->6)-L-arabinopyranosidase [Bifidobacterium simiarum]
MMTNIDGSDMPAVRDLTLEERASLTSGADPWHMQGIEERNIPECMITDGPHGLRKAVASRSGDISESVPATCFPPAAGLSSAWDPDLVRRVGEALGEECIQEKVAVLLGPGVNIKRNPLGGRCFEYWSEDPYLAGHEAIGIVEGVQSKGVGTSLKHFAVNNQETDRLRVSANVSERALREIYLPAFEHIVTKGRPWTVMCSYNRINGVFSSQNRWLLTDLLRGEWGYDGIVMSDWGACHDRVAALAAGQNLEMPPTGTDGEIVEAVNAGRLDPAQLDRMAQGIIDLVDRTGPAMAIDGYRYDVDAHDALAREAAAESIVLLKNDHGILPLAPDADIAVIGEFARTPRYQGGGSSHLTPNRVTSLLDAMRSRGSAMTFAPGFTLDDDAQDPALAEQAVAAARDAQTVVLCMGLPEQAEIEGRDRTDFALPAKQIAVLEAVAAVNPNIVVVLSNGSAVAMDPWRDKAAAILEGWLLGQAGGAATADVLYGDVNPGGRLSQTIPLRIEDDPSMTTWPGENRQSDYGEDIFVGYRYYDTFDRPVAYPFGFGLSYASFGIDRVRVERTGPRSVRVSMTVTNVSDRDGAETVQIYVTPGPSSVRRPVHELRGFAKVRLAAGESREIGIDLDSRAFAYWSVPAGGWKVEGGVYGIEVGVSSRDIVARIPVEIEDDGVAAALDEWSTYGEWRDDPVGGPVLDRVLGEAMAETGRSLVPTDEHSAMMIFLRQTPVTGIAGYLGKRGPGFLERLMREYRGVRS